jgi:hypothetical protein
MNRTKKLAQLTVLATTACLTQAAVFAQEILAEWAQEDLLVFQTQRTAVIGDMDGDLLPELAIGVAYDNSPPPGGGAGRVEIIGSMTGSVIQTHFGTGVFESIGFYVHALPDLDGDGLQEIMSTRQYSCSPIILWSSPRPNLVIGNWADCSPSHLGYLFGQSILAIADEDGDGLKDLLVGGPGAGGGDTPEGMVSVVSSATGLELRRIDGLAGEGLGQALANAGDHNGDGRDDVWVGAPGHSDGAGAVVLLDGRSGERLSVHTGPAGGSYGSLLVAVPDQNGDGLTEYVATAPLIPEGAGQGYLVDGMSGTVIMTMHALGTEALFGAALAFVGDTDGDGRDEVAISGAWAPIHGYVFESYVAVYSLDDPRPLRILTDSEVYRNYGTGLSGGLDFNGDGLKDIVVTTADYPTEQYRVEVISQCYGHTKPICDGGLNSVGMVPELTTCAVIDYDRGLHFALSGLPSGTGALIYMAPGDLAGPIQPIGTCLGNQLFAVPVGPTGPIFRSTPGGTAHVRMSLSKHAPFPSSSWLAGTTWAFQANYADIGAGGVPVLAWSDAIELTLP